MVNQRNILTLLFFLINLICIYLLSHDRITALRSLHPVTKDPNALIWNKLLLLDTNGNVILNKSIQELWQQPLSQWDYKNEILAFLHIVKSGGTSFDASLYRSVHEAECRIECRKYITTLENRTCPSYLPTLCKSHFDWTTIEEMEHDRIKMAPLMMLRNPLDRVASHFYVARKMSETKGNKIRQQNFSEFLRDVESMMETRQVWYDGQVFQFAVTFIF